MGLYLVIYSHRHGDDYLLLEAEEEPTQQEAICHLATLGWNLELWLEDEWVEVRPIAPPERPAAPNGDLLRSVLVGPKGTHRLEEFGPLDTSMACALSVNPVYTYLSDSQHLRALAEHFPRTVPKDATAAYVWVEDGDYRQVWVTDSSRPYEADTRYERVW